MSHHGRNTVNTRASKLANEPAAKIQDSHPYVEEIARTEASRPVSAGSGKQRGDRRDMSPTYTTNEKHASRGNTPRKDVTTRAR
jgi:hypothetical protein